MSQLPLIFRITQPASKNKNDATKLCHTPYHHELGRVFLANSSYFSLYRALNNNNPIVATYNYNQILPNRWYRISKTFVVDAYTIQQTKARIELNYYDNNYPYYFGYGGQNYEGVCFQNVSK